jgi:hypothetical protein
MVEFDESEACSDQGYERHGRFEMSLIGLSKTRECLVV